MLLIRGVQHLSNESIWLFFNAICLSVEMLSDSRRCHWDVVRLFLSFQLSRIVFLAIVKANSMGCLYFSGGSTDERGGGHSKRHVSRGLDPGP